MRQDINWSAYKKVPIVLARNKDGKYIQLTDSNAIISILSSFLTDPSIAISELVELYPNISFINADGKKMFDILNKYHVIHAGNVSNNLKKDDLE